MPARAANERTVTIANTATTSDAEDIRGQALIGVITPSTFDGTTLQFSVCMTLAGTYTPLVDLGTGDAVGTTTNAAASEAYAIDPILTIAWNYIKVVAGAQTGDSVITLCTRAMA